MRSMFAAFRVFRGRFSIVTGTKQLVSGMLPSVMSEIRVDALGKMCMWASRCGLGMNPKETELILFMTKTRISFGSSSIFRLSFAHYPHDGRLSMI